MVTRSPNINRSRVHESWVQILATKKLPDMERTLFPTIRELLCFAALLGYSEERRIPLDRTNGVEDVSYQQFERGDAEDLIYLIALADTRNFEILRDGKEGECAKIFEEYVNGGLEILQNVLKRSGGEFPDRDIKEFLIEKGYLSVRDKNVDLNEISF